MFRRVKAIVTIITARWGFSRHYGPCGTGVDCHSWVVTDSQAASCGVWALPEKMGTS